MVSRRVGWAMWLLGGIGSMDCVRKRRQTSEVLPSAKLIAGIPLYNFEKIDITRSAQNDYLVMLQPGVSNDDLAELCKASMGSCVAKGHPGDGGLPYLKFRGTKVDLESFLQASSTVVSFVEPDLPMEAIPDAEEPADPSSQANVLLWGLNRVGVKTRVNEGEGVHIYVLDTGIRTTHNDFGGRAVSALDMTQGGDEGIECHGDLKCAGDRQGHGTHCAGSAAGTKYGVASSAFLHGIKVLANNGRGEYSWAVAALDYVMAKGAKPAVASMSLGGPGVVESIGACIDAATDGGVVVVVAGGNSNDDACKYSPAFAPSAITVGSTNPLNTRSIFSNYGACTDIWAPGSQIISAGVLTDWIAVPKDGTSMACPHVSGGAAIVLSANPSLTPPQVLESMLNSARTDLIWGLKKDDVNKFLWVGAGPAP